MRDDAQNKGGSLLRVVCTYGRKKTNWNLCIALNLKHIMYSASPWQLFNKGLLPDTCTPSAHISSTISVLLLRIAY